MLLGTLLLADALLVALLLLTLRALLRAGQVTKD